MADSLEHFYHVLRTKLSAHGAVADFCRKTGITRSQVDGWIRDGVGAPGIDRMDLIASGLGIEPWELLKPPRAPAPTADSRLALFGAIVSRLAALNEPQLRFLLPYVDSAIEIQGAGQRQELRDKNRKL